MFRKKLAIIVLVSIILTGCSATLTETGQEGETSHFQTMEEDPDLSYEIPESSPHVLVNQLGYATSAAKVAIFCGSEIPDQFQVIDSDTGEIVYTGETEKRDIQESDGSQIGYGDFSEVETTGSYYIEAPILGESYTFQIADRMYDDVLKESLKKYYYNRCGSTLTEEYAGSQSHNACHTEYAVLRKDSTVSLDVSGGWHQNGDGSKNVAKAAESIGILLLSYELFGDVYTDEMGLPESRNGIPDLLDEVRYEVDWLLKMQNAKTGEVYSGVTMSTAEKGKTTSAVVEEPSLQAAKAFVMSLAKFSYLYQDYDQDYASSCLQAANRTWRYIVQNEKGESTDSWKFAAAAELYRVSGSKDCNTCLEEFFKENPEIAEDDLEYFLGSVTYMMTTRQVNKEYCSEQIEQLLREAETLSTQMKKQPFYVCANEDQTNQMELLQDMLWLVTVNHIITNYEYETVIENHLHYFMGRNKLAISYIDDVGIRNYKDYNENLGIMNQFDENSRLVFMLSEIVSLE